MLIARPELLHPTLDWVHPELRPWWHTLHRLSNALEENRMDWEKVQGVRVGVDNLLSWIRGQVLPGVGGAMCIPLLDPTVCQYLQEEVAAMELQGVNFAPNEDEDGPYQIPEVVLSEQAPKLYDAFSEFARGALFPLFRLLWGRAPERYDSIQLARYTPEGTANGNWHHDEDSMYTAVVTLNQAEHKGGGVELAVPGGLGETRKISSPPTGYATLFNGHQTLHRGLPVESGVRDLLVFWMTSGRGQEEGC